MNAMNHDIKIPYLIVANIHNIFPKKGSISMTQSSVLEDRSPPDGDFEECLVWKVRTR